LDPRRAARTAARRRRRAAGRHAAAVFRAPLDVSGGGRRGVGAAECGRRGGGVRPGHRRGPELLDGYAQLALLLDAAHDRAGLLRLLNRAAAARGDLDPVLVREAGTSPWPGPAVRAVLARAALAEAEHLGAQG